MQKVENAKRQKTKNQNIKISKEKVSKSKNQAIKKKENKKSKTRGSKKVKDETCKAVNMDSFKRRTSSSRLKSSYSLNFTVNVSFQTVTVIRFRHDLIAVFSETILWRNGDSKKKPLKI